MADVKPMTGTEAKKMVDTMRNIASESSMLDKLEALKKSPHCMLPFVQSGGLEILAKWLRRSEKVRCVCLKVLPKLPVTFADLQKADIIRTLEAIQCKDKVPHHRENATALIEQWKAAGNLEPPTKKPRLDPPTVAQAPPSEAVATPAVPQPCTPPLETLPAARPEEIPKKLESLDPIIVKDLLGRQRVLSYLEKRAPSILQNLHDKSLLPWIEKVLLRHGQPASPRPEAPRVDEKGELSVRVSGLAEESREGHIQQLFCDINISPLRISLPIDSRCKKSCGTAFVVLESLEHAKIAVDRLNGARLHRKILTVDCNTAEESTKESSEEERVKWNFLDSQVVIFSKDESVETFRERIDKEDFHFQLPETQQTQQSQAVHRRFQAARRTEEKASFVTNNAGV